MQKVYLEISGVDMPYSVVGRYLYDDERFYVLNDGGIKKKIRWTKILYIEDIESLEVAVTQPNNKDIVEPVKVEEVKGDLVDINVFFTGHKEQTFKIEGVSRDLLKKNSWSPELAKTIFSTQQVRAFMGNFVVSDISVSGENVYIKTVPTSAKKSETLATATANSATLAAEKLQKGAEVMGKIFQTATEPKFKKPTGNYPTSFNMVADPFDLPVNLGEETEASTEEV